MIINRRHRELRVRAGGAAPLREKIQFHLAEDIRAA
jgi:hypothetical protein